MLSCFGFYLKFYFIFYILPWLGSSQNPHVWIRFSPGCSVLCVRPDPAPSLALNTVYAGCLINSRDDLLCSW